MTAPPKHRRDLSGRIGVRHCCNRLGGELRHTFLAFLSPVRLRSLGLRHNQMSARRSLSPQIIKVVGPPLHHLRALFEVLRAVVGSTVGVLDGMRQLRLDHQRVDL